jgi:peptidyl-prolyl cis-trans isomerase-like protein 2
VNWFGVKLAKEAGIAGNSANEGGVGKYLNLKRTRDVIVDKPVAQVEDKDVKKRKIGFGDFEGW